MDVSDIVPHPGAFVPCSECGEPWADKSLSRRGECPVCAAGRLEAARVDIDEDARCQELAAAIPPRYRGALKIEIQEVARRWHGTREILTFVGKSGTGKTWAATRSFAEAFVGGAKWTTALAAAAAFKRGIETSETSKVLSDLNSYPLLLLDDYRAVGDSEWIAEQLRAVICHRFDWMLPTILTLDQPLDSIEPRIARRLRAGIVVEMTARPAPGDAKRDEREPAERPGRLVEALA